MKLSDLLNEEAADGAISSDAVAGVRDPLMSGSMFKRPMQKIGSIFKKPKRLQKRKQVAGIPVIRFKSEG